MLASDAEVNINQVHEVETSIKGWQTFIDASMASDFFQEAYENTKNIEKATALTLLDQYISIFEKDLQKKILEDVEVFYSYAKNFIEELSPYRYNKKGYDATVRTIYISKIRKLLQQQKNAEGKIIDIARYEFIRTLVKFLSSLSYVIAVHDNYREYRYRIYPQLHH